MAYNTTTFTDEDGDQFIFMKTYSARDGKEYIEIYHKVNNHQELISFYATDAWEIISAIADMAGLSVITVDN